MVSQPKIDYINRLIDESLSEGDDTIELKGKFIGDEGVEALAQSSDLANIEDLDLSNNNITWRTFITPLVGPLGSIGVCDT